MVNYLTGFKGRITLVVSLMLIVSLSISNFLSYRQLSTAVGQNIDTFSQTKVDTTSDKINAWFQTIKSSLAGVAPAFAYAENDAEILSMVKQANAAIRVTEVLVGYEDGRSYAANLGQLSVSEYDPRTRGWYINAKRENRTYITDIYQDAFTKNLLISIAEPFYKNDQLQGVMIADIELTVLNQIVNDSVFDHSVTKLLDNEGVIVASTADISDPGKSKLADDADYKLLQDRVLQEHNGQVEFSANNSDKISYFKTIKLDNHVDWHLVATIDKAANYQQIDDNLRESVTTAIILIVVISAFIALILKQVYRPILELKETVIDLADGNADLTQRLKADKDDDLGQIAQAVNRFIGNLQTIMLEISASTQHISAGITDLKTQTDANDAVLLNHADETQQVVVAVNQMSCTADSVAQSAALSADFTQQSSRDADNSRLVVQDAVDGVDKLVNEVEAMESYIQTMNEDTHKISSVLGVIGEIADQTNLLALNAAIEAARAGEQGRGFAVVADEVRTLAARTQKSTSEISDMLTKLRSGTDTVVSAMSNTKDSCQQTAIKTASVHENLDSMSNSVTQINDLGLQITTAANEQNAVTEEINRNMTAIQTMVDELTLNSTKTLDNTNNLASCNAQLVTIVGQFKLN